MVYEVGGPEGTQRRSQTRRRVVKSAVLIVGDEVLDCIVLDLSDAGARVRLTDPVDIPEQVTLKFPGGPRYGATRRWSTDREIGFSIEAVGPPDPRTQAAWRIYEDLRMLNIRRSLSMMNAVDFFGDAQMRTDAEQVEAGLRRLEAGMAKKARGD